MNLKEAKKQIEEIGNAFIVPILITKEGFTLNIDCPPTPIEEFINDIHLEYQVVKVKEVSFRKSVISTTDYKVMYNCLTMNSSIYLMEEDYLLYKDCTEIDDAVRVHDGILCKKYESEIEE